MLEQGVLEGFIKLRNAAFCTFTLHYYRNVFVWGHPTVLSWDFFNHCSDLRKDQSDRDNIL